MPPRPIRIARTVRALLSQTIAITPLTLQRTGILAMLLLTLAGACLAPARADAPAKKKAHAARNMDANPLHLNSVKKLERYIAQLKAEAKARHKVEGDHDADADKEREKDEKPGRKPSKREEETEGAGTDYLEAYLYWYRRRAYPKDTLDWAAYTRAEAHRDKMPAAHFGKPNGPKPALVAGSWQFVGPSNLPVPYITYYGQYAINGRINALAYSPGSASTYYLGAASGGVWKTTNGGTNWTPLSDTWPSLYVSSIAVHPTDPNILYVGTGDFDGGYTGFGLMKSQDGGLSWTNVGTAQLGGYTISSVVVDPETPTTITCLAEFGEIWQSTDSGNTWTAVNTNTGYWRDLKYGLNNGGQRYLYAANDNPASIWRSADRGVTWTKLTLPSGLSSNNYIKIAPSATAPGTVYMIAGANDSLYKSTNAGTSWTSITTGFPTGSQVETNYNWSQSWYDIHIECAALNRAGSAATDAVYVGLIDLAQSPDGGATWRSIGGPTYSGSALIHNDQHALAVNPTNPNDVLVANDGGVYHLTFTPGSSASADTWSYVSLNANLGITQFYDADFHPTDPNTMLGGTQDNASPIALSNITDWDEGGGGDGGFSLINQTTPTTQYTTSEFNQPIYMTTNSWNSATYIETPDNGNDPVDFVAPITLDPTHPNLLYAGTDHLYQYNTSTGKWSAALGGSKVLGSNVSAITVAPTDTNRIYTGSDNGQIWMSTNQGSSWTQINSGTTALPTYPISCILVSATNENLIYVGLASSGLGTGHIWTCANANASASTRVWTDIGGSGATALPDISLNTIAFDIDSPTTTFYVGTDVGVFYTNNGGSTWSNATNPLGLPNVAVNKLSAVAGTRYLNAATYGRGIWRIPLIAAAPVSISGIVNLQGSVNLVQPITFQLRPSNSAPAFLRVVTLASDGSFTLPNVTAQSYTLAVKGAKWLQSDVTVDASAGNVTGVSVTLLPGDMNGDNVVDLRDFNILAAAFGTAPGVPNWNPLADLDCNGVVDLRDFNLLATDFGLMGDP